MAELQIDLFCVGNIPPGLNWELGQIWVCESVLENVANATNKALASSSADAWLFWDPALGIPPADLAKQLMNTPDDLWHAGLKLGMASLPHTMDFVSPTWMLNRDPDPNMQATSWRVSLRACLVRTEVIRQLGFMDPHFTTLEAAALDWGHRCITRGALCRHVPELVRRVDDASPSLPVEDEVRFILNRFGKRWAFWTVFRAFLSGYWSPKQTIQAWQTAGRHPSLPQPVPYWRENRVVPIPGDPVVSVLIPTVERYPYLEKLLGQLRQQTIPAAEIIVVDQTPTHQRQPELYDPFQDLPLKVIYQEKPGQCSSRNAGLSISRGDFILFIDDDDEIQPDLIEKHLTNLQIFNAEVSSGVAHEVGAGPLPEAFTFLRFSDVFPTNNSMIRRSALQKTGLFDLAYDHGARADADLGMRLYLSGARMILDPEISVVHHHAPRGGLRLHKARVITYASSRQHVWHRSLASATELYLVRRYFTRRQQTEFGWLGVFSSFSIHSASLLKRLIKIVISGLLLPDTIFQIWRSNRKARMLASVHPTIPYIRPDKE